MKSKIKINKSKYFSFLQCTKKLYLDLNTDINPWTNNLNRSLNKNIMMDYVKDYFVTKFENINLKQIFGKMNF
ncbi:MAG TPA: hypothetical protein EYO26_00185 [Dehalococcoidia bacterium]|nr:hypothetical protein [Dehalococcoidia bacterium]